MDGCFAGWHELSTQSMVTIIISDVPVDIFDDGYLREQFLNSTATFSAMVIGSEQGG